MKNNITHIKQKGIALIEFALIAPIFLLLLFAIFELSLLFFTSTNLDIATNKAVREIKVGITRSGFVLSPAQTAFKNKICDFAGRPTGLIDCDKLKIDVFPLVKFTTPNKNLNRFQTGIAKSIIGVRVEYPYEFYTPMLSKVIAGWGERILITKVFINEPQ